MKIENYVKKHWDELPKSHFNDKEVVIVKTLEDENSGYGNHNYAGIGINSEGEKLWCYSCGCSCHGTCNADKVDKQIMTNYSDYDLSGIDPKELNFESMQVSFADYE